MVGTRASVRSKLHSWCHAGWIAPVNRAPPRPPDNARAREVFDAAIPRRMVSGLRRSETTSSVADSCSLRRTWSARNDHVARLKLPALGCRIVTMPSTTFWTIQPLVGLFRSSASVIASGSVKSTTSPFANAGCDSPFMSRIAVVNSLIAAVASTSTCSAGVGALTSSVA